MASGVGNPRLVMQNDAVSSAVIKFERPTQNRRWTAYSIGQARGKIILPCGTGKTRISLRLVEEMSPPGALSVVLCPSIALVAQIPARIFAERQIRLHTCPGSMLRRNSRL